MPLTPRCCQGCRERTDMGGHSRVKRGLGPAPTEEAAGMGQPLAHRGVGMGARGEVTHVAVKHSKWKTDAQMLPQGLAGNSSAWAQGCGVHANSVSICSRAGWTRCSCPLSITTRAADGDRETCPWPSQWHAWPLGEIPGEQPPGRCLS